MRIKQIHSFHSILKKYNQIY